MITADDISLNSESFVIRLLNSPLQGCEFPLQQGKTLFVIGQTSTIMMGDEILPVFPVDTFYVPLEKDGVNFEIQIDSNASVSQQVVLCELGSDGRNMRSIVLNAPTHIGGLVVAVRAHDQLWSSSVLMYPRTESKRSEFWCDWRAVILILFFSFMLILSGWICVQDTSQRQITELNAMLGGEKNRFQVLSGRNNSLYIFAENKPDYLWVHQMIASGSYKGSVQVTDADQENKRLAEWIGSNYPMLAYFRLQLDNPKLPQFWISRQRSALDKAGVEQLTGELMALLPYADSVAVVPVDDAVAVFQAENGLKQRNIKYSRKDKADNLTFTIKGALDDTEIFRARKFIYEYYRKWGMQYVQFSIELKDDWLKKHSFEYGVQSYVKIAPNHWDFSNPL
ncbi:PrgH/EprH family type III secretion apparatus protein [Salmonella enterica]|nr:PrgH/EprH family type III secretion apparatus protein [Salmonella enterica]